ncbi:MAG: TetR/AcrR family transcriptional regulator [Clostridiaceae bacterium]|nr:TetR/AcrR family transcriptional regulator [Clostridiaceae bacterium]
MSTKENILKTAFEFFISHAYADVSINDIVKKVGITKGGFYHYFKSKEELFEKVMEDFLDRYYNLFISFFKDESRGLKEKLDLLCRQLLETYNSEEVRKISYNPIVYYEIMNKNKALYKKAVSMVKEGIATIRDLLEKEKEKGILRSDLDCEGTAFQLLASLKGMGVYAVFVDGLDLAHNMKIFIENFWRSVAKTEYI